MHYDLFLLFPNVYKYKLYQINWPKDITKPLFFQSLIYDESSQKIQDIKKRDYIISIIK